MILTNLSRKERVSKIDALAKSQDNQAYSLFFDYFKGIHFSKQSFQKSDYGRKSLYRITTRSGVELFDDYTDEDKVLVKANWCKPIVKTIADYTRGINEDIVITSEENEENLSDVWKKNNINIKIHEIANDAGIFGKTFIRIRRKDKASPIEVLQVDPGGVYEVFNSISDERESVIYFFSISKEEALKRFPGLPSLDGNGDVYYFEEWDNGLVYKYVDGLRVNEFNVDGEVKDGNPYGFVPFIEIPANIYRESDIKDVISLNDELNITYTNNHEIFKYGAFPMLAPKGTFSNDTPVLTEEQMKEVEISPRTILPIPMEKVAGEGVDDSVMKHIEEIKKDISITSGVPVKILTAELDGNLSGVALERMLGSVLKQAEVRRNYIRDAVKKVNNMILSLLTNAGTLKEFETDVIFPEMMKIDMNERLDESIKKQSIGISKETIFEELGYDYKEENKKAEEEFNNSIEKRILDEENANNQTNDKQGIQSNNPSVKGKGAATQKGDAKENNKSAK